MLIGIFAVMLRVITIKDFNTIIVEKNGTPAEVRLAGVEVTDRNCAYALLQWTLTNNWVLVEGTGDVYRSPDAMYINRELVLRGCARATAPGVMPPPQVAVTYLGESMPAPPPATRESRTSSSTSRRSTTPPPRAPRARSTRSRKSAAPPSP